MIMSLQKPQLRRMNLNKAKVGIIGSILVGVAGAMLFKIFITDKRQRRYKEFYKTYDLEKQLKIMNEAGLMQSYVIDEE
ncbi:hypothetical protein HN011_005272 [Eciton burchellii]|nr:hypothetical protein HN011_005272 [Eciton burchellii]